MVFQFLLIVSFQWTSIACQLNLYDTDQRFMSNSLQFDCLNYRVYRETLAYQEVPDVIDEIIPYCFRLVDHSDASFEVSVHPSSQKLSFEELRMTHVTSLQLLLWSTPIEMVERYQLYLSQPDTALNEHIYNCTPPRFGLRCQYSFAFSKGMSFNQIVEANFGGRSAYSKSSDMMVQMPCYVLLKCHRHGQLWCLDWREVCDEKMDCFDEGLDEESCFDMEINECNEDEYRCHNGLCISQALWEDGLGDTDCLDRSDTVIEILYTGFCFRDPTFRCEEHSCRVKGNPFPCGDGQCVPTFEECRNGRHSLLIESMTAKGTLTNECWMAMLCLTKLVKKINENLCDTWLMRISKANTVLQQCNSFFQFPTIPVYSNHVRFFYQRPHLKLNQDEILLPDYVCYDQQLCDSVIPDFSHENLTCLNIDKPTLTWNNKKNVWNQLMLFIKQSFFSCSFPYAISHKETDYSNHPSLYNCRNSWKFISKHRIMDGISDCFGNDDEKNYGNSCQLNDRYRVTCHDASKCWSPLVKNDACRLNGFDEQVEIPFQSFCDGIKIDFYDNNKQIHDDEFGCEDRLCNNMYARCDGFWTCSDGRDEDNCSRIICPSHTYACVSRFNFTLICLPSELVNNKVVHCLGAMDEQLKCRRAYPLRETSRHFRCSVNDYCLRASQLCDENDDCPDGEDEEFCQKEQLSCNQSSLHNRSDIGEYLCGLKEHENRRIMHFSVHTSTSYPSLGKSTVPEFNYWPAERHLTNNANISQVEHHLWPWYCNRGLAVHTWMENNSSNDTCICPPSYYGHLCQYQNQRISLTLRLTSQERHTTYAVISMLMDDNDQRQEINAYDQSLYIPKQSCSIKLNRYLLFPSRPKNIYKNYSVRIDVYDKNAMTYVGSWHFPITFLFLPVNRLSISLNLSNHQLQYSSSCSITCHNGECVKYVNKHQYFCRCFSNWSGIQCNISVNCQTCLSTSICIGSTNNRSICVCPIGKFGPQCRFNSTCPINACQNNGQCLPADVSMHGDNYTCLCPDQFFGQKCEHRKAQLDVSLDDIYVPSYLVAYFFTLSNKSDPIETTILRKLTLFQHIVTFHIAIPFQLVLIRANTKYYLAALQQSPKTIIRTSINPRQECPSVKQLFNNTILKIIPYQRILHFHLLCQTNINLTCFIDDSYLCLCTNDQHANCIKFNGERNFQCPLNNYCVNEGQCFQDHPTCPSTRICLCPSCFFGNRCQFYAKGLGSTLDEILGYEFKYNAFLSQQPITVKMGTTITIVLSLIGIINSILSIITFSRIKSQEVGCGIYLLGSSITSLLTMILFTLKFSFLFFTHQDVDGQQNVLKGNCFGIEPALKVFFYLDSWLNACVAIERTISVLQGITFNKKRSRVIAVRITIALFVVISCLFIPQFVRLRIFYDETEERSWCVIRYAPWLQIYSTILIFFHYFAPLTINLLSILLIIIITTRQRILLQPNLSFWFHLRSRIKKHKHVLISSAIIICFTLPHLIISIILDCQKSSHLIWFYLLGYFLSLFPATFIFIIFVLPSPLYRGEFYQFISYIRRRWQIFRLNSSTL